MRIKRLLLFTLLILSACKHSSTQAPEVKDVVIESVDLYPKYPGCEDYYEQDKQLSCLIEKMNTFVNYMIEKKYKQEFSSLHDTLWAGFVIDTTGATFHTGILYKDSLNKTEFNRIFTDIARKIPKIKPAIYRDKPVNFEYKIPIIYLKDTLSSN